MPTSSIVFSPEIDDRALNKETKQINQQLEESASNISPEFDQGGLDSLMPAGGGGMEMGGGGMGPGGAAGVGALASRIPKPIAGVTAAAALPVALAGGIGVGMLSAMHGASARLQTSTSLLGMAWNAVWRPIGNKVDQLFVRDAVLSVVDAVLEGNEAFRSADWLVDPMARAVGDIMTGDTGGAIVNLGVAARRATTRLTGLEWPTLSSQDVVGGIGWPTLSAAAIANPITWPAIGAGMLLNQVGFPSITAQGVLGNIEWPTLTFDAVMSYLTDPSKGNGGSGGGGGGGGGGGPPSKPPKPAPKGPNGSWQWSPHRRAWRWVSSGSQFDDGSATGGGGGGSGTTVNVDNSGLEESMERVHREIKRMNEKFGDFGISVDGEQLGRVTQNSRQNRISDTDPTVM